MLSASVSTEELEVMAKSTSTDGPRVVLVSTDVSQVVSASDIVVLVAANYRERYDVDYP